MKRILIFILSVFLGFSYIGCGEKTTDNDKKPSDKTDEITGPYINWSNYFENFKDFQDFYREIEEYSVNILTIDSTALSYDLTEYTFDGGVRNTITGELLGTPNDFKFSFSFQKDLSEIPFENATCSIQGVNRVLVEFNEVVDYNSLLFELVNESETDTVNTREYAVKWQNQELLSLSITLMNVNCSMFDTVLLEMKNNFIKL